MGLYHTMVIFICALCQVPHGQAYSIVLPHLLTYNAKVAGAKVVTICELFQIPVEALLISVKGVLSSRRRNYLGKLPCVCQIRLVRMTHRTFRGFRPCPMLRFLEQEFINFGVYFSPAPEGTQNL
jgi:hypothetical protein